MVLQLEEQWKMKDHFILLLTHSSIKQEVKHYVPCYIWRILNLIRLRNRLAAGRPLLQVGCASAQQQSVMKSVGSGTPSFSKRCLQPCRSSRIWVPFLSWHARLIEKKVSLSCNWNGENTYPCHDQIMLVDSWQNSAFDKFMAFTFLVNNGRPVRKLECGIKWERLTYWSNVSTDWYHNERTWPTT